MSEKMALAQQSAEIALNSIIADPAGFIEAMGWDEQQFAMNLAVFSVVAGMSVENMVPVHRVIFEQLGYTGLNDEKFILELRDNIRKQFDLEEENDGTTANV